MGLRAYIFRSSPSDYSAGGVSCNNTEVYVENAAPGLELGKDDLVSVSLRKGAFNSVIAVPTNAVMKGAHTMFGGTFIYSCDSRFGDTIRKITGQSFYGAVPFHDRIEL